MIQSTVSVTYLLKDHIGEVFEGGGIYEQGVGDVYLVEKILQAKGDHVRVRYHGFDGKHGSRISKADLI